MLGEVVTLTTSSTFSWLTSTWVRFGVTETWFCVGCITTTMFSPDKGLTTLLAIIQAFL